MLLPTLVALRHQLHGIRPIFAGCPAGVRLTRDRPANRLTLGVSLPSLGQLGAQIKLRGWFNLGYCHVASKNQSALQPVSKLRALYAATVSSVIPSRVVGKQKTVQRHGFFPLTIERTA
jgi:hypothetical protein